MIEHPQKALNREMAIFESPEFQDRIEREARMDTAREARAPKVLNKKMDEVPPDAAYVGRPSKYGNPFVVGKDGTREECVELYRRWLMDRDDVGGFVAELRGRDLVCWCAPKACHADVLLEVANA